MTARTSWLTLLVLVAGSLIGCATAGVNAARMAPAAPPMTSAEASGPSGAALPDEKLVVTGSLSMSVDHGPAAIAALRASVEAAGGRVVHEEERGHDHHWTAHLRVRLPPGQVADFLAGVGKVGRIDTRRIEATDVSREYFDQEVALQNLRITLARLQALLANPDLQTANVLEIERELTRVRGEIEHLEGAHRFLQDRIAYATFELDLSGSAAMVLSAQAQVYPGVRGSVLYLIDAADGADRVRPGAAVTLAFAPRSWFELDIYPATDASSRAVMVTLGGATYSDFFGAGLRRWLNPYLGGRSGYAYLDDRSRFVVSGEAGLELFRSPHLSVDLAGRAHALIDGDGADAAIEATAGVTVPF